VGEEEFFTVENVVAVLLQEQAPIQVDQASTNVTVHGIASYVDDRVGVHYCACRPASWVSVLRVSFGEVETVVLLLDSCKYAVLPCEKPVEIIRPPYDFRVASDVVMTA
jgi:hypothetical protein